MRTRELVARDRPARTLLRPPKDTEAEEMRALMTLARQGSALAVSPERLDQETALQAHAEALARAPRPNPSAAAPSLLELQRRCGNHFVQRMIDLSRQGEAETSVSPEVEQSIQAARGGGHSLDDGVRIQMEQAFGADFGHVRVHTDGQADTLNHALNARAFTTGKDIFFKQDEYNPASLLGRELLAHELTHVVQQNGRRIQRKLILGRVGDRFEQEADSLAHAVMSRNQLPGIDGIEQRADAANRLNCWGSAEHETITSKAAEGILHDPLFVHQVATTSSRMDYKARRLLWTGPLFLGSKLIASVPKSEGPEHGEGGNYTETNEEVAAEKNVQAQNRYLTKAMAYHHHAASLKKEGEPVHKIGTVAQNMFSALGDAFHIAQDRGAHAEGVAGKGHADPRTKAGWSPDDPTDNAEGYQQALVNTRQLLVQWHDLTSLAPESAQVSRQSDRIARKEVSTQPPVSGIVWSQLPTPAQETFTYSFENHGGEWIWQGRTNAQDTFDAASADHRTAFYKVYSALAEQGLWSSVVKRVSDFWPRKTHGLSFEPVDRQALIKKLSQSMSFCRDKWIGGGGDDKPKWRQLVATATPGVHIVIPSSGLCEAHLDTLSPTEGPAKGREEDGRCNYDVMTGIRHWWKEEEHWWD